MNIKQEITYSSKTVVSLLCLLIGFIVSEPLYGQTESVWGAPYRALDTEYFEFDDHSISHLKAIASDEEESYGSRMTALSILADKAGQQEKEFILHYYHTNLFLTPQAIISYAQQHGIDLEEEGIDPYAFDPDEDNAWDDYYDYVEMRGYLGDQSAVEGMDTVATYAPEQDLRVYAIRRLAQAGIFKEEYFQELEEVMENREGNLAGAKMALERYGTQSTYRERAGEALEQYARQTDDRVEQNVTVQYISYFDRKRAAAIADEFFRNTSGARRSSWFFKLGRYDQDGQPERSIWAIPRAVNDDERSAYIPRFSAIIDTNESAGYISPKFVHFLREWVQQGAGGTIRGPIRWFLRDYQPLPPPDSLSTAVLLDSLVTLTEESAGYDWITPPAFADSVLNAFHLARQHLEVGDEIGAQQYIMEGMIAVEEVYSTNPANRSVTDDGYTFIVKYAEFLMERFSQEVPTFQGLLDQLKENTRAAKDRGWLSGQSYETTLVGYLDQAQDYLMSGDSVHAASALAEFARLLEDTYNGNGPAGAILTTEGYQLLSPNAQSLQTRLPAPPENNSGITCGCDNPVTQSSGTVTIRNGETRCLDSNFSGAVFFESGGTLNVCATASFQNIYGNAPGVININEDAEVSVGNWNNNQNEDAINNWGTAEFTNRITVNRGTLANYGALNISGGLNQNNGSLKNHGELNTNGSVILNQADNVNEGTWAIDGNLTLNSQGGLENSCRIEASGRVMINGTYRGSGGGLTKSNQRMTINSSGSMILEGDQTMVSVPQLRLNGTINSTGDNLLSVENQFNYNNQASVEAADIPLNVCSPNIDDLISDFNISNGCQLVIPASTCNPEGYNTN